MSEPKAQSLSDQVFDRLEADILNRNYKTGESLTELRLSADLGVSRTPIRDALRRLEQEGLVHTMPGKGTVVTGVSLKDLADIYEIRIRIEGLAAHLAAERITDEQLDAIGEIVDLQEFYTMKQNYEKNKELDGRFHSAIYDCCGSQTLTNILTDLHRKIQYYRMMSMTGAGRAEKMVEEHRELFEAMKAHDGERAEAVAIRHMKNARDNMIAIYREKGL